MRLDPDLILNQKSFAIGNGAKFGFYVRDAPVLSFFSRPSSMKLRSSFWRLRKFSRN